MYCSTTANSYYVLHPIIFKQFCNVDCSLDFRKGKKDVLEKRYAGTGYLWLEDSVDHAEAGDEIGMDTYIFDHPYNRHYTGKRVHNWKELYDATH